MLNGTSFPSVIWVLLLVFSLSAPEISIGQVNKCVNSKTGKTTYTDGLCPPEEAAVQVLRKQTPEEIKAEREQAALANARLRQELKDQETRRIADVEKSAASSQPHVVREDKTGSFACKQAKWNLEVEQGTVTRKPNITAALVEVETACGINASAYLPNEESRKKGSANRSPNASSITRCDSGGCWDNMGAYYVRNGNLLVGPNGKTCNVSGSLYTCN